MAPVVHGLEQQYRDRIDFLYLHVEEPRNADAKRKLGFTSTPHFFFLPQAREEHSRMTRTLVASAIAIWESVDEIAFHLPADAYDTAAQFVAEERLCCPFLRFTIEVSPGPGPIWLRISGPVAVTEFLRAELQLPVPHG